VPQEVEIIIADAISVWAMVAVKRSLPELSL
jgi:hypothetical protein